MQSIIRTGLSLGQYTTLAPWDRVVFNHPARVSLTLSSSGRYHMKTHPPSPSRIQPVPRACSPRRSIFLIRCTFLAPYSWVPSPGFWAPTGLHLAAVSVGWPFFGRWPSRLWRPATRHHRLRDGCRAVSWCGGSFLSCRGFGTVGGMELIAWLVSGGLIGVVGTPFFLMGIRCDAVITVVWESAMVDTG